jgi:putative endonuclease
VYILASGPRGTLYIGVTKDLIKRVYEHRQGIGSEFTKKYSVHRLVYYEDTTDIEVAIAREKQLKKWNSEWKIELIISMNPQWKDLYEDIYVNS